MRYAKRIDSNQTEIIAAFERLGCQVLVVGEPVDLAIVMPGSSRNVFVEVKDGSKPPSARKHTPQQVKFFADWRGDKATVSSLEDVINLVKLFNSTG